MRSESLLGYSRRQWLAQNSSISNSFFFSPSLGALSAGLSGRAFSTRNEEPADSQLLPDLSLEERKANSDSKVLRSNEVNF